MKKTKSSKKIVLKITMSMTKISLKFSILQVNHSIPDHQRRSGTPFLSRSATPFTLQVGVWDRNQPGVV